MPETLPSSIDIIIDIGDQAHAFVARVKNKTGRWPMIYGGNMLRDAVQDHDTDPILRRCPLSYARYRSEPVGRPTDTWPRFNHRQYTDGRSGPLPHAFAGMGATDRDCFCRCGCRVEDGAGIARRECAGV